MGDKRYVLFTLEKARKAADVLVAVEEHNRRFPASDLEEELLMASDGMLSCESSAIVLLPCYEGLSAPRSSSSKQHQRHASNPLTKVAVFDKGHAFQSHEIFRVICSAKLALTQVDAPPIPEDLFVPSSSSDVANGSDRPSGYWSWGSLEESPTSPVARKRAISALASDLVEEAIKPAALKRVSFAPFAETEGGVSAEDEGGGDGIVSAAEDPRNEALAFFEQQVLVFITDHVHVFRP